MVICPSDSLQIILSPQNATETFSHPAVFAAARRGRMPRSSRRPRCPCGCPSSHKWPNTMRFALTFSTAFAVFGDKCGKKRATDANAAHIAAMSAFRRAVLEVPRCTSGASYSRFRSVRRVSCLAFISRSLCMRHSEPEHDLVPSGRDAEARVGGLDVTCHADAVAIAREVARDAPVGARYLAKTG